MGNHGRNFGGNTQGWGNWRKPPGESGDKVFPPYTATRYEPTAGEATIYFMPPRGVNGSAFVHSTHWPQGGKQHTCTKDLPHFDGRCVGCEAFPEKTKGARRTNELFEVVDFRYTHWVPEEHNGKTRLVEYPCAHQTPDVPRARPGVMPCKYCADRSAAVAERHGPARKMWAVNYTTSSQIFTTHQELSATCLTPAEDGTLCLGHLVPYRAQCSACGEDIDDPAAVANLGDGWGAYASQTITCGACGEAGFPHLVFADENGGRTLTVEEMEAVASGELDPENDVPTDVDPDAPKGGKEAHYLFTHYAERGNIGIKPLVIKTAFVEKRGATGTYRVANVSFDTSGDMMSLEEALDQWRVTNKEQRETLLTPIDLEAEYGASRRIKRSEYDTDEAWVQAVLQEQADDFNVTNPFASDGGEGGTRRGWAKPAGGGGRRFGAR